MKKIILIATGLVLGMNVAKAQLCLGQSIQYSTGSNPYSICKADFNNDGKLDLATANSFGSGISILIGDGTGSFGAPINSAGVGNYPQGICAADFNNDNNMDVAVTNAYGSGGSNNRVNIFKGNGDGTFQAPTSFTVGTGPISICTGDFNSDGNADLATCNTSANNVSVVFGNGNATFGAVSNYITMSSNPYQIICADFNGDGKLDLATADNTTMGNVSVYYNQGTGTFNMGSLSASGNFDSAYGLCSGDFNGDGRIDIAVAYFNSGAVAIIPNNGGGTFGTETTFTVGNSPTAVCAGDFNGDSKLDVGVTNYNGSPQFFVMLGDGAGNLGTGIPYSVGSNPYSVISGDFDANGKTDVAMSNYNGSNVSVLLNGPPVVTISGTLSYCASFGGTSLSGTPAQTYTWSSGGSSQYEYVTPGVGTTSYTLTEANGVCTASAVATVTVIPNPTITVSGSYIFCSADSTLLTANGATSYNWACSGPGCAGWAPLPTTNTLYVNAAHAGGNLMLNGTSNGCSSSLSIPSSTFSITTSPNFTLPDYPLCSGQSIVLSPPTIPTANSYSWSTGATTMTISVSPSTTTSYTLTETNTSFTTCAVSKSLTVNVTQTPAPVISGAHTICMGSNIVLTGSSATAYAWSTGATTQTVSVNPTSTKTYTLVESTPLIGGMGDCKDSTTATVNVVVPSAPNICMVTVDSLSQNNLIIWDKTLYPTADTFYVYRDTSNNNYCIVGRIPKSQLSQYADTARHIGAVNGDPNITTYRYKLAYKDSCGNVSPMGPYHNTIYQYNTGSLFLWNAYQIEGQSTPVPGLSNYVLKRDNLGATGNYITAATAGAAAGSINDPQYATYQSVADWRVETVWNITCVPSYLLGNNSNQAAIVKSKSNITNNRTTGVKNNPVVSNFTLFPNPTNGNLTIAFANANTGKVTVRVVSVIGQEAYNETFVAVSQLHNIDLSKCEAGVYLVQVTTNNNTVTKRIVKN